MRTCVKKRKMVYDSLKGERTRLDWLSEVREGRGKVGNEENAMISLSVDVSSQSACSSLSCFRIRIRYRFHRPGLFSRASGSNKRPWLHQGHHESTYVTISRSSPFDLTEFCVPVLIGSAMRHVPLLPGILMRLEQAWRAASPLRREHARRPRTGASCHILAICTHE